MSIFIDFHVLQSVPPSCVNRDDMGSPKTAVYGGAVRARVSSQAWKHAVREYFKQLFTEEDLGSRTKNVVEMVEKEMLRSDPDMDKDDRHQKAVKALELAGLTVKAKKGEKEKADALFFMSFKQAKAIADIAVNLDPKNKETANALKEAFKEALKADPSVDIALFGRMAASDPTLNYDAAAQVAHAISTHAVQNEYDYFTAVDDLQADDNAGAGHLGTVEFNSSTLYRYAVVNASELASTLGAENVADAVKKFGQAFIMSMPTGKINTFANRTLPDMVYVTVRSDQPVNLCGAFENPMKQSEEGYTAASEKRLLEYAERVYTQYAAKPEFSWINDISSELSLPDLLDELGKTIDSKINGV